MKTLAMKQCKARKKNAAACESAVKWSRIRQICEAYRHKLGELVPGDELGRTYAEWIAAAVIERAMHGDLKAVTEILEATEKQITEKPATAGAGDLLTRLTLEEKIEFLKRRKHREETDQAVAQSTVP
jgi:hypothetical protein